MMCQLMPSAQSAVEFWNSPAGHSAFPLRAIFASAGHFLSPKMVPFYGPCFGPACRVLCNQGGRKTAAVSNPATIHWRCSRFRNREPTNTPWEAHSATMGKRPFVGGMISLCRPRRENFSCLNVHAGRTWMQHLDQVPEPSAGACNALHTQWLPTQTLYDSTNQTISPEG
jgi:hypothetical protein